ncbi:hypothetical protein ACQPZF_25515 [Actinosynnema sp. CS-041913]|uniref:hypothetical protein n=1 Tax=Actinosynnema sp. CS-041913 TaxID=3239917 RepID=UPI003D8A57BC
MTQDVFGAPFVLVVGLTTDPDEDPEAIELFDRYYSTVHLPEMLKLNPGFVTAARFESTEPDPGGTPTPRWLAVYGIDSEQSARDFVSRDDRRPAYSPGPPAWGRARPVWRMIWRTTAVFGGLVGPVSRTALIGMSPAAGADPAGLAEFDQFYSRTHLPEIVAGFGYDRGTRLELWHEFRHPAPGCPRFCAVYEGRGARTTPGSALTPGPDAWENREVSWRVKYRPLTEE